MKRVKSDNDEGLHVSVKLPTCFQVKITQMGLGLENLNPLDNELISYSES